METQLRELQKLLETQPERRRELLHQMLQEEADSITEVSLAFKQLEALAALPFERLEESTAYREIMASGGKPALYYLWNLAKDATNGAVHSESLLRLRATGAILTGMNISVKALAEYNAIILAESRKEYPRILFEPYTKSISTYRERNPRCNSDHGPMTLAILAGTLAEHPIARHLFPESSRTP